MLKDKETPFQIFTWCKFDSSSKVMGRSWQGIQNSGWFFLKKVRYSSYPSFHIEQCFSLQTVPTIPTNYLQNKIIFRLLKHCLEEIRKSEESCQRNVSFCAHKQSCFSFISPRSKKCDTVYHSKAVNTFLSPRKTNTFAFFYKCPILVS